MVRQGGHSRLPEGKFYDWRNRYGNANEHNAWIPRDHGLEKCEKRAIISYAREHPLDGYRQMTFDMIGKGIACVSLSSTYRVLKGADLLGRRNSSPTKKGVGFQQPLAAREHWHTHIACLNISGIFCCLCQTTLNSTNQPPEQMESLVG